MVALICDRSLEEQLISERRAAGIDKFDEIWDGVYVMAPMADDEHQDVVKELTTVFTIAVDWAGLGKVRPGINVSDRKQNWIENYRCPDVAVFLADTKAENHRTFWFGGPDFAVEVISPDDRSLEKIPFYETIGTRELLLIDRDPWTLTLLRLEDQQLLKVAESTLDQPAMIVSEVIPLRMRLVRSADGPQIEIVHDDGNQRWTVIAESD